MSQDSATNPQLLDCPRCGASVSDPEAGHCSCCGASIGLGGRDASGARAPLRMTAGPGQALGRQPARVAPAIAKDVFAAVRAHGQYELWMQEQPAGLSFVLGIAVTIAIGLVFAIAALSGSLHSRHGSQDGLLVPLFACVGAGIVAWGVWRLVRFYQAPLLQRVARVAAEREHTYRTRHGWRTRHYATFEFEDSTRSEFCVSTALAEQLTQGDGGVAITRDSVLLAFHRA
jgi:hypothetical protein